MRKSRTTHAVKRTAMLAAIAGTVTGFCAAFAPSATADSVSPHGAAASTAYGFGQVRISTEAGGFIKVQISGRQNAVNTNGPMDGLCVVRVGGDSSLEGRVKLNGGGFGELRFGPLGNGSYEVSGTCADRYDGAITLTHPSPVRVTIDGTGPAGPPAPAIPQPDRGVAETLNQYCNRMADATQLVPPYLTVLAGGAGEVIDAAQQAASIAIRGYCGYVAGTIGDAQTQAEQFCRIVEDQIMNNALLPVQSMFSLLGLPATACGPRP